MSRKKIIIGVIILFFVCLYKYSNFIPNSSNLGDSQIVNEVRNFGNNILEKLTLKKEERKHILAEQYIVKEGDTLDSISSEYNLNKSTLIWANNLQSENLKVGDEIVIPPTDGVEITVKEGDTLDSIAEKYHADSQAIADYNWLDYPFTLTPGDKLFIPDGTL